MSHLGDVLSALVDGELTGAELDRANAHLAACGACRAEANALRRLKHDLRSLAEVGDSGDITGRLLAMTSQVGQDPKVPLRHLGRERVLRRRISRRRRRRYLLWSALSLLIVGVGTAAFGLGAGSSRPVPRITPQLEVFDVQHALVSGDVPFAESADASTRVPVGAATP
jgi:anti-sigma factor RsiW